MKIFVLLLAIWLPNEKVAIHYGGTFPTETACINAVTPLGKKLLDKAPDGSRIDAGCAMFIKEEAI